MAHNARMLEEQAQTTDVAYPLAVIMERIRLANRWATEQWEAKGVVRDTLSAGSAERVIFCDEQITQILFPGFVLKLRPDEAEGYYLNITSPRPKVFVLWRMLDGVARPQLLTVSYQEGARWMDGGEQVDGVALPQEMLPWLAAYAAVHYKPEPKKKPRYASSKDKGVASRR
jgi:hypothetical protein